MVRANGHVGSFFSYEDAPGGSVFVPRLIYQEADTTSGLPFPTELVVFSESPIDLYRGTRDPILDMPMAVSSIVFEDTTLLLFNRREAQFDFRNQIIERLPFPSNVVSADIAVGSTGVVHIAAIIIPQGTFAPRIVTYYRGELVVGEDYRFVADTVVVPGMLGGGVPAEISIQTLSDGDSPVIAFTQVDDSGSGQLFVGAEHPLRAIPIAAPRRDAFKLRAWPSPVRSEQVLRLTVPPALQLVRLALVDVAGRMPIQRLNLEGSTRELKLRLPDLAAGVYLLLGETASGETVSSRVVVVK